LPLTIIQQALAAGRFGLTLYKHKSPDLPGVARFVERATERSSANAAQLRLVLCGHGGHHFIKSALGTISIGLNDRDGRLAEWQNMAVCGPSANVRFPPIADIHHYRSSTPSAAS
jgi:hypothetical protein